MSTTKRFSFFFSWTYKRSFRNQFLKKRNANIWQINRAGIWNGANSFFGRSIGRHCRRRCLLSSPISPRIVKCRLQRLIIRSFQTRHHKIWPYLLSTDLHLTLSFVVLPLGETLVWEISSIAYRQTRLRLREEWELKESVVWRYWSVGAQGAKAVGACHLLPSSWYSRRKKERSAWSTSSHCSSRTAARTSGLVYLFFSSKTCFSSASRFMYWWTDIRSWACCIKGTALRPELETKS